MGNDFSAPFFSAVLIDPDGNRYPLWQKSEGNSIPSSSVGGGPDIESLPWVTELSVELQLSRLPIIRVRLEPPYPDAIALLESPAITWGRTIIEVRFGYAGSTTGSALLTPLPFTGVVTKPSFDIGTDVSISLEAQGVSFGMNRVTNTRGWNDTARIDIIRELIEAHSAPSGGGEAMLFDAGEFETQAANQTAALTEIRKELEPISAQISEVRDQLASKRSEAETATGSRATRLANEITTLEEQLSNLQAQASALSSRAAALLDTSTATKLNEKVTIEAGARDDWFLANDLAWQCGCYLTVEENTVRLLSRDQFFGAPPRRTMTFYYAPGGKLGYGMPDGDRFPILGISSPTPTLWLPRRLAETVLHGMDAREREEYFEEFTDENQQPTRVGTDDSTIGDEPAIEEISGNAYDPIIARQAEAEYRRLGASNLSGVQLEIETIGIPDLMPSETIRVRGLGLKLDGNYAVTGVTHRFDGSGYGMSITAISNATSVVEGANPAGPINDADPPASGESEDVEPVNEETAPPP